MLDAGGADLFVWIHASKAALMAGLTALGGDVLDLLLGAVWLISAVDKVVVCGHESDSPVGKISRVLVSHCECD